MIMQALSVGSPPIGDFWRLPEAESSLGFSRSVLVTRKRRRKWVVITRNLSGSRYGLCNNTEKFNLAIGSSYLAIGSSFGCYSFEGFLAGQRREHCFPGSSVALAWESFEQATEDDSSQAGNANANGETLTSVPEIVQKGGSYEVIHSRENGVGGNSRVDVLSLAKSLQSAESAEDVDQVMMDKGLLPLQVYSSMIKGFGREKKLEPAFAIVDWLNRKSKEVEGFEGPNLFIYNSLLGAVKQSEQFDKVDMVIRYMAQNSIFPNVVTYNTLMTIRLEQGQALEALSILEEIRAKGLSPSPISYSTALIAYNNMNDGFGALKLFVELREKYTRGDLLMSKGGDWGSEFVKLENFTNRICYQVMRRWLAKETNIGTQVLKLLLELDKAGLTLSRSEHEKLIWACTREEHCTVAKELYTRIREREPEISLSVCNHVIWLMGRAKKWWAALEIYEELLDKGPKPDSLSYELIISHFNILLAAAKKRGIWRWGVRLLNKMESKGLKPGSREWNAVLVACSKAAETEAAVQIFRRMIDQGEKPTIISYGALLSALEKGKLYDEAIRVWEHMIKVGVEPNLYAFTTMASVYVGLGKFKVVDILIQEMISTNNSPSVVTFNAIISVCARKGWGNAAYEWFHKMRGMDIEPNTVTYEMLIEALAKDGKPRLAFEMYVRASNESLSLASKAYDLVVQSSHALGAPIDMGLLGPRPLEKKKKVHIRKNLSEFCHLADVPRRSDPFEREEIYSQGSSGKSMG